MVGCVMRETGGSIWLYLGRRTVAGTSLSAKRLVYLAAWFVPQQAKQGYRDANVKTTAAVAVEIADDNGFRDHIDECHHNNEEVEPIPVAREVLPEAQPEDLDRKLEHKHHNAYAV